MTESSHASGPPPAGPLLGGRYRLGPVIGRGGMATIHRATDVRLERDVAVKILRPEVATDPDLAHRFRREALAATVLRHPNIVACLDTGTDGDRAYLVMALIDGEDLAARLRRSGRLAPWQAARIGLDVARALAVAHVRGIVHRDIKPGNILLAADGRAMVADFGIARLAADAEAALPGTTLGSVHYFSPEQARGRTTTPASDIYGLGLVMFEALTGTRAWTGETTDAIALARIGAPAPSPRALRPEVPAALDAVVRRALAPEPGDRYPNGMAMAAALEPVVEAADPAAPTVHVPTSGRQDDAAVRAARRSWRLATVEPRAAGHIGYHADASRPGGRPGASTRPGGRPGASTRPGDRPGASSRPGGRPGASTRPGGRPGVAPRSWPSLPGAFRRGGTSPLLAVFGVIGVVTWALLVAARPGDGSTTLPSERPPATGLAEAERTAEPAPTRRMTPAPTALPSPAPTVEPPTGLPPGDVADLCAIFFDIPCALGAGRYSPSRFQPAFDIEIGDGWSTSAHTADTVALRRDEGAMMFAGRVVEVYPGGQPRQPRERARDLIEAFIATDGVGARRPANVRIDGRRGLSADLTPIDSARVQLFATVGTTFHLEPDRTTRVVVMDLRRTTILLAIEPHEDFELAVILETADEAAGTIRWR